MPIELSAESINAVTVERAYRLARSMQRQSGRGNYRERVEAETFAHRGLNAAKKRDKRMMVVLERATAIIQKTVNDQVGQYQQRSDIPFSHQVDPTELQMWREAYKMADQGQALANFQWIYGCAAWLAYGM